MGSFFKNLLKSNPQSNENGAKKSSSKWRLMFKKAAEQSDADQNLFLTGQEDNQGRLRNSNSASSLGSIALSDKSLGTDCPLLLPKLKSNNFSVPRYIPPNDWIRSQLFEVAHLTACFVDLVSPLNASLAKDIELKLEKTLLLIDDKKSDLKQIFTMLFNVMSFIYQEEINLLMELKLEVHLNSLISQLVELCSQLPGNGFSEVMASLKVHGSGIDFTAYKRAKTGSDGGSFSRSESCASG